MPYKIKLSKPQLGRISEVLGNVSVAWFTVGVISPIFLHPQNFFDFIYAFALSLSMSVVFLLLSLVTIKGVK